MISIFLLDYLAEASQSHLEAEVEVENQWIHMLMTYAHQEPANRAGNYLFSMCQT